MADIFNEIDEDVRRERYEQLWKRYGNYVIGAALLVVLATTGAVGWREYTDRQNKAQALRFLNAMEQAQKGDDAGAPHLVLSAGASRFIVYARPMSVSSSQSRVSPKKSWGVETCRWLLTM